MRTKTDAKRRAILAGAAELFKARGFAGVSMSAVSQRVGGSKATLYRYFASKEDLFLSTLLDSALDQASRIFDSLVASGDLGRDLERFGERYLALALSAEVLAVRRILIAEGSRAGIGDALFERGPKVTWSRMAAFLKEEMRTGRVQAADGWTAAMHLRGLLECDLINRALVGARVDRRPAHLRQHAREAARVWMAAYGQAAPRPSSARATPPSTGIVAPTT